MTLTSLTGALAVSMLFDCVVNGNRSFRVEFGVGLESLRLVSELSDGLSKFEWAKRARERQGQTAGVGAAEHQNDRGESNQEHTANNIGYYLILYAQPMEYP